MSEDKILELIDFVVGYSVTAMNFNKHIPNAEVLLEKFIESQK